MLVKGSTNFHEVFDRQIKRAIRSTERFGEILEPRNVSKWWPQVREVLRKRLLENLSDEFLSRAPISARYMKQKREKLQNPTAPENKRVRLKGGPSLGIISSIPWRYTDTMKNRIGSDISRDRSRPRFANNEISMTMGASVEGFIESDDMDYSGLPYPIAVDGKMMERSGDNVGLVRLTEAQVSEILELLIKKNEKVADRIFRGTHFQGKF